MTFYREFIPFLRIPFVNYRVQKRQMVDPTLNLTHSVQAPHIQYL